ncbi:N-acetyltransferase [Streptomyces sp. WMMB 322]|uniref:GNAT family N-acetyltransferase n=1 Tax=Streptomyces sp. WMMB 322 TaxID=1286821 RepID=UPI0006E120E5|nr:GNAT family N-acetyltransferase [Streptomyces sp. WMMB 322]SCK04826.1 Ribosomal protein S18 acetylase RimI [Streptomyces sp. WMMB 322]
MAYKIRAVLAEDWALLRELRLAALADPVASVAFNETYELSSLRGDDFWRRRAAQGTQGSLAETFVGEDEEEGRWVGSATVLDEGESAHVVGVYVRPAHRGSGLAAQLFQAVEDWACERPRVKRMLLHVHEHNPRAEGFYRKIGYVRTGGFVSDPKAPVLKEFEMVRELPPRSSRRSPGAAVR